MRPLSQPIPERQVIVQAINLCRFFGDFQAVKPLDFTINAGEIVVLTGPNGAGKTTLLSCLSGILPPTRGHVLVEGFDLYRDEVAAKQRLAYVPDVPRFYPGLTAWEHLQFISLAFGVRRGWEQRAESLLGQFGIWESRDLYPHNLSRGMRLKLGLSLAFVRPFKALLMDEPTSALDPESALLLRKKLISLRDGGCALLLTSHDLGLVESLGAIRWRMENGQLDRG